MHLPKLPGQSELGDILKELKKSNATLERVEGLLKQMTGLMERMAAHSPSNGEIAPASRTKKAP